jgi:hypothetical protein
MGILFRRGFSLRDSQFAVLSYHLERKHMFRKNL